MPMFKNGTFGVYAYDEGYQDAKGKFTHKRTDKRMVQPREIPYVGVSVDNQRGGLTNWHVKPEEMYKPRTGDLTFFHATRQLDKINGVELESKSEAGEFLPGFYTTSGTDLAGSLKLGWYWYESPAKNRNRRKDWHIIRFVLRREFVKMYLLGPSIVETAAYYLQEPTQFAIGGGTLDSQDTSKIEFVNRNSPVMIFPDQTTKVRCGRGTDRCSLEDFVLDNKAPSAIGDYNVIVGLQKPPPLNMRQQCWVAGMGLWHINHAERYVAYKRGESHDRISQISNFVQTNSGGHS